MHPLQSHILKRLTTESDLRYVDLKPVGIESNRFVYHLKNLLAAGLVEKGVRKYQLTARGKRYIDKLSLLSFQPRFQPKIVTVIVCQNPAGEYLLYKSKRQPLFERYCFPFGKIHFGETIAEAAARELKEKTGLAAKLDHRGEVYLSIRERGEIVSHMLCHVFLGSQPTGLLVAESPLGACEWARSDKIKPGLFAPGFRELFKLAVGSKNHFFAEITK